MKILLILSLFVTMNAGAQLNPYAAGTINPGDSIVIYYDVTINNGCGCTQISCQGTVTGANFSSLNTNDPDTGIPNDPTITLLNLFPLPVRFMELKAKATGSQIMVSWVVSNEENLSHYEVEKSNDGINYFNIGSVNSTNSAITKTYTFVDPGPHGMENYYRLKIVEQTGSHKHSIVVRVNLNDHNMNVLVYPNPVTENNFNLQLNNMHRGYYQLQLFSSTGQVILSQTVYHDGGSATKVVQLPGFIPKGIYNMVLKSEYSSHTRTLVLK